MIKHCMRVVYTWAQGSAPNCVRGGVPFGVPNTQGGGPSTRYGMSARQIMKERRRLGTSHSNGKVCASKILFNWLGIVGACVGVWVCETITIAIIKSFIDRTRATARMAMSCVFGHSLAAFCAEKSLNSTTCDNNRCHDVCMS